MMVVFINYYNFFPPPLKKKKVIYQSSLISRGGQTQLGLSLRKKLNTLFDIYVNLRRLNSPIVEAGLKGQFLKKSLVLKLGASASRHLKALSFQVKYKVNKYWKVLASSQFISSHFVLFLGFQKQNISLQIPVWKKAVSSSWELVGLLGMSFLGCVLSYKLKVDRQNLLKNDQVNLEKRKEKKQTEIESQKEMLKLLQQRSSELAEQEIAKDGLVIEQAYMSDRKTIEELVEVKNIPNYLYRNKEKDILDVTIPLRFYVQDSKLSKIKNINFIFTIRNFQ
jgi:Domain of unknown function (DUF3395)